MSKIKDKLATKLMVSILLMAIPIFLVSMGLLFVQSQKAIHEEAIERANSSLNTTMQRVRNYMTIVETATNSNTWFAEQNFKPDSLLALTNRIVRLNSHVTGCSITAEPGMFPEVGTYFSAYTIREGDSIITQREAEYDYYSKVWYEASAILGKALWSDPFDDFTDGSLSNPEMIASYSKPLYKDGKLLGVIATDLSLKSIDKLINTSEPPYPGAYFVLLGQDGRYFIHPDTTKLFRKNIFTDADPNMHADMIALGHEMTQGKKGSLHVEMNGKLYHVCYSPVTGTSWSIALVCLDSEILKNYNHLTYIILAFSIIGLLVILWLCRQGVNHAISPLNELLETSQKISEGQYDLLISHTDREDAIGSLQNSFATMHHSLTTHVDNIRQTTKETEKSNEDLANTMKLAKESLRQKDIFIQNVSHQIRTPLNIIQGFAHVLHETPDLSKKDLAEITKTMKHNALHLNRMILMLFDSSDMGATEELKSHQDDLVSCNQIASECINYTREHFPDKNIMFLTDLDDNFKVHTNHLYLMRTLRELLYNAAKYSDGQNILMRLTYTDMVRFTVEDKGQGLPEGSQEIIFNPFTKIDDLSEGLGLGLPLAKRHARSLGGNLTVDTSYQEGCRFTLEIPKA
jgi:signal transduction histidine kinase